MLSRIKIVIGGVAHTIPEHCLKNWEDITVTLERKDYGGVTRKFTSEFQFVDEAYDLLMYEYEKKGVFASATIQFFTINNRWVYNKQFECDLDFTSINYDGTTIGISAIDNSLASQIKSKKSTKYEFKVGADVGTDLPLNYDRITMENSASFILAGTTIEGSPNMLLPTRSSLARTNVNSTSDETYENSPILIEDESESAGSFFVRMEKDADFVYFDVDLTMVTNVMDMQFSLYRFKSTDPNLNNNYEKIFDVFTSTKDEMMARPYYGLFANEEALFNAYPTPESNAWAIVGQNKRDGIKWYVPKTMQPSKRTWINSGCKGSSFIATTDMDDVRMNVQRQISSIKVMYPKAGEQFAIFYKAYYPLFPGISTNVLLMSSSIKIGWESRGETLSIPTINPQDMLNALLNKMCNNTKNVRGYISTFDDRMLDTRLLAAESIRGIDEAKIKTSFNDFCNWMATVFGYTYTISDILTPAFSSIQPYINQYADEVPEYVDEECPVTGMGPIGMYLALHRFLVYNSTTQKYYSRWNDEDWQDYNDPETGMFRQDVLYHKADAPQGDYVYFDEDYEMQDYTGDVKDYDKPLQEVRFVHFSELYGNKADKTISNITDFKYEVNNDLIYSNVTIGYDKQDYDKKNGRNEWNFSSYYDTDVSVLENTYELTSRYRADSYGIEFTAQKRHEDSTDDKSDNNVFFILCKVEKIITEYTDESGKTIKAESDVFVPDRECTVVGVPSSTFNHLYSPMYCLQANKQFLCAMKEGLVLRYASSDGKNDITINGSRMTDNVTLADRLFTVGEISFKTDDMKLPSNINGLVSVKNGDAVYNGYIRKAQLRLSKDNGAEYTMIVKEITK